MALERVTQGVLFAIGVCFLIVAALGWFDPRQVFYPCKVTLGDPCALAEVRAAYGGLFGATGGVFMLGVMRKSVRLFALRLSAIILGGFVFGRLVSLGVDGVPARAALVTLALEFTGMLAGIILLALSPRK